MRKKLLAAVAGAVLVGAAGVALAQEGGPPGPHGMFQADANGDGVTTRQEFDAAHDAMFGRLDADSDGRISREEFRQGHRRGPQGPDGRGGPGSWREHHRAHLDEADANQDGNITRDEFLARPLELFARLDANRDGVISAQERQQAQDVRRGHSRMREGRNDRPNPDANNDGQITREEFRAAGAAHFDRMDANHDGRVTREEMQVAFESHHGGR